jgi:IclR family mhp operon transcriptional activator
MSAMSQPDAATDTASRAVAEQRIASRERLQALERGLEALAYLNRYGACTSGQVARALRLKRSTAHRMLSVLVSLGLLRHDNLSHQYILCARVRELSSGFRDEAWITGPATTRMSAWTREHRWPLVLTTPINGLLTVRASTDYESPISVDRFLAGQVVPVEGSAAGILFRAYSAREPATLGASSVQMMKVEISSEVPDDLAAVRRAGYVARLTACFTGARMSVPLVEQKHFIGCITMRCRPETIEDPADLRKWATSLKTLAREIRDDAAPMLGLA